MQVQPVENQTGTSATEPDVYYTGAPRTEPGCVQMVKQDLVVVTCGRNASSICAEKVGNLLRTKTRLNNIACMNLLDSENDKVKTWSGKVLFLLSERNQDGMVNQILSWINALKQNNHNTLKSFFVTIQHGQIDHQVLGIEYENENNSFVVPSFEAIFQWWPQFLREMFGSSDSRHDISFKSVELLRPNNTNNPLVEFVKQEFSVYEDNKLELENANKIIVITDGPIHDISQELKQSLRNSKLNGAGIYLYASETETFQGNALVNKISTKHYTLKSEMEFLLDVMIDFGVVKNKIKRDSCGSPAKPAGIIHINNLQEKSAFLEWGEQDQETSAGTNIVIRQKIWYDGKWAVTEENLPGYVNGYEVKGLDTLNQMYIFSVVREDDNGVSDPLVSDECTLMQKHLDIAAVLRIIGLYIVIGLVLILNVLQSFIGLAFVVFLISFAISFYVLYRVLSFLYRIGASTETQEIRNGRPVIVIRPPSSSSMHSEVCFCVGGIFLLASRLLVHACFGNANHIWEYLFDYLTPIIIVSIGFIAGLAINFNVIILAVFVIVLLFGVGWCIAFHYVLIYKFGVENGVYGLAMALKEKLDDIHPYKFRQTTSTELQTVEVEHI